MWEMSTWLLWELRSLHSRYPTYLSWLLSIDPLCFHVVQYISHFKSGMNFITSVPLQSGEKDEGGACTERQYQLREMTVTRTMMMAMHNTNIDVAHVAYTADPAEKNIQLKCQEIEYLVFMTCRVIYIRVSQFLVTWKGRRSWPLGATTRPRPFDAPL